MRYEDIISMFTIKQKKSDSCQCICPSHDDKQASLTISKGRNGKTVLHCHAGCETKDVLQKVGLRLSDLYDDENAHMTTIEPKWVRYVQSREHRKIEHVYTYQSLDGKYAVTKLRLEGKKFIYGILKNEKFSYGLNGIPLKDLIYGNLKKLSSAIESGTPVFIPEGEKDVDTLTSMSYVAVTYGGAENWHKNKATIFQNAIVYILADNDDPGKKVAHAIVRDLDGIAKKATIIIPMPETEKADISDYFAAGHSKEEFDSMIKKADCESVASKAKSAKTQSILLSMNDVVEKDAEWLVAGYIPKGQVTIMAGDGGTGKTFVWVAIAAAISTGRKVFFEAIPEEFSKREPQDVIFFSSEDSLSYTLKARLRKAGADLTKVLSISLESPDFMKIKFDSSILESYISKYNPALVIFDPLQAFIPASLQMSQRNAMRQAISPLIGLGEKYKTTFLIICHTNKRSGCYGRNRISDSADIWDIARSVLICGKTGEQGIHYLSQEKSNYAALEQTALFTITGGAAMFESYTDKRDIDFVREIDTEIRQAPQREAAEKFIVDFLSQGEKPTAELDRAAKAAGISPATLSRAKTELSQLNILGSKNEGYGKNKVYKSYLRNREPSEDRNKKTSHNVNSKILL